MKKLFARLRVPLTALTAMSIPLLSFAPAMAAAPSVNITGVPATTNDSTPVVGLQLTSGSVASAVVSIDDGPAQPWDDLAWSSSVAWYQIQTSLADGAHTVIVVATDANAASTTVSQSFTVDTVAPTFTLGGPTGTITTRTPSLTIADLNETSNVTVAVDGAAAQAWVDPAAAYVVPSLADGSHTVTVAATDEAGNVTTQAKTFTVDATGPTLTQAWNGNAWAESGHYATYNSSLSWAVTFPADAATRAWRFDGGTWTNVPGAGLQSINVSLGSYGLHTVEARATDAAGNTTVVTSQIDYVNFAALSVPPNAYAKDIRLGINFLHPNAVAYQYQRDGGAWTAWSGNYIDLTNLSVGAHNLTVQFKRVDTGGVIGTNKVWSWSTTADTVAPVLAAGDVTGQTVTWTTDDPLANAWVSVDGGTAVNVGKVTSYTASNLSTGSHTVTVYALDTTGNKSNTLTQTIASVDVTAPDFTLGVPGGTSGPNPVIWISAWNPAETAPTGVVTVDGGAPIAWANPKVNLTLTGLTTGTHTIQACITDESGNTGCKSRTVTTDATPPTLAASHTTTMWFEDGVYKSIRESFQWTATIGADATVREWQFDGGAWTTLTGSPVNFSKSFVTPGTHTMTLRVRDALGNEATFTETYLMIDPFNIVPLPGNKTDQPNVRIELDLSPYATPANYILDTGTFTSWSGTGIDLTGLSIGPHVIKVWVADQNRVAGPSMEFYNFTVTADTTAPALTKVAPPAGAPVGTVQWTTTEPTATNYVSVDGGAPVNIGTTLMYTPTNLSDGSHIVSVYARDAVNTSNTITHTFIVDTTAPAFAISMNPGTQTTHTPLASIVVTPDEPVNASISIDGSEPVAWDNPKSYTALPYLEDGTHALRVVVTDTAGNSSTKTKNFTIDTTAPTADWLFSVVGKVWFKDGRQGYDRTNWNWELNLPVDATVMHYKFDNGAWTAISSRTESIWVPGVTPGVHSFSVRLRDAAGNEKTVTREYFQGDDGVVKPVLTLTANPGHNPTGTVTWTTSKPGSGVAWVALDGAPAANVGNVTSYNVTGLGDGTHTLAIYQIDEYGNQSTTVTSSWTVDTTGPAFKLNTTSTFGPYPYLTASITSTETTVTAEARINGGAPIAWPDLSKRLTLPITTTGSYTLTVNMTDAAGNTTTKTKVITVDADAPTVDVNFTTTSFVEDGQTKTIRESWAWTLTVGADATSREWRFDGGAWTALPATTNNVSKAFVTPGVHTVDVRASDQYGNETIVTRQYTMIDPFNIVPLPGNKTDQPNVRIEIALSPYATPSSYILDNGTWQPWTGTGIDLTGLAVGPHILKVWVADQNHITGPSMEFYNFQVVADTTAPIVTKVTPPAGSPVGTVTWTNNDPSSNAWVSVDGGTPVNVGSTTTYTPTGLADGEHTVDVYLQDPAGNKSDVISETFTIDTTAPVVSYGPTPGASSNATITWTLNEPGTSWVSIDGAPAVNVGTDTHVTLTGLTDGPHTVAVHAVDTLGNTSTPTTLTWTVDTTAPTLAWEATAADGRSTGATFTWTTTDADAHTWVKLDTDLPVAVGTDTTWTGTVTEGTHTLRVWSLDATGNVSNALTHTWTVDLTGPAFTVNYPSLSNDSTPEITITGNETPASVTVSIDGRPGVAWGDPAAPYTLPTLTDGDHDIAVTVTDPAGNETTQHVTVSIDTTPTSAAWGTKPATLTNDATGDFTWTTNEPTRHWVSIDNTAPVYIGTDLAYTTPPLADGPHTIVITGEDAAANQFADLTYTWTVDASAPVLTWGSAPVDGYSTDATFTWTTSEPTATTWVRFDGNDPANIGNANSRTTPVSLGQHTVTVWSVDQAGNISNELSHSWTVTPAPDTTAPTLTWVSTPNLATRNATATFMWSSNEAGTATVSVDGQAPVTTSASTYTTPALADGSHTIVVRVTDAAGNVSAPLTYTWLIDATGPVLAWQSTPSDGTATRASFTWTSDNTDATTWVRLDGGVPVQVGNATSWTVDATVGQHTVTVWSADALGNPSNVLTHSWTIHNPVPVDRTAPILTWTRTPSSDDHSSPAQFRWTVDDPTATVWLAVDGGARQVMKQDHTNITGLEQGTHTVTLYASDPAGNEATPLVYTWTYTKKNASKSDDKTTGTPPAKPVVIDEKIAEPISNPVPTSAPTPTPTALSPENPASPPTPEPTTAVEDIRTVKPGSSDVTSDPKVETNAAKPQAESVPQTSTSVPTAAVVAVGALGVTALGAGAVALVGSAGAATAGAAGSGLLAWLGSTVVGERIASTLGWLLIPVWKRRKKKREEESEQQ